MLNKYVPGEFLIQWQFKKYCDQAPSNVLKVGILAYF